MSNISFFIPAYNCAATICEAVESILADNFVDGDELIIVNDCSTDNTAEILNLLKDKYSIIQILSHKRNKGGAAARNTAIENTGNELLFCLDSDNVLASGSISPLKQYLQQNQADLAVFQFQHFFSVDKFKPDYTWELPPGIFDNQNYFTGKNTPGQHGNYLLTKRSWEIAGGYAEGTGALDTWTFGLRQAITGAKTVILKDSFYYHRLDYRNSYWMRDAETNLWSVSIKATHSLIPFFDQIDEDFISYMLGSGRYRWFYDLNKRPIKIVKTETKEKFYQALHHKINKYLYPYPSIIKRCINKIKQMTKNDCC